MSLDSTSRVMVLPVRVLTKLLNGRLVWGVLIDRCEVGHSWCGRDSGGEGLTSALEKRLAAIDVMHMVI